MFCYAWLKSKNKESMVRFLSIIILVGCIGSGLYYLFSMEIEDDLKVTGKLQVSAEPSSSVDISEGSEELYFAAVHGKIKNNLNKPVKNVFVKYTIAGQKVSATIFDLAPGQQVDFNTHGVKTSESHPSFDFEGIHYD